MSLRASLRAVCCALIAFLSFGLGSPADAAFLVDGDLTDWEIANNSTLTSWDIGANAAGTFTTSYGLTFKYVREDSSDSAGDSGFVGPNHGGQNYDGEFLAVGVAGGRLVIAIVTGQRPDNGLARYSPGDIRIGTSAGLFGVEVGGGAGGGSGTAITEAAGAGSGSTYVLNTSTGLTTSHQASPLSGPGSDHTAGAVFSTLASHWILDPIAGGTGDSIWPTPGQDPVQLQFTGGTFVGLADYIYTRNSLTTQKAVIELAIPLHYFGSGNVITSVRWAPSCGNDMLYLETALHTPEPSSFLLGALGMIGVGGLRRLRRTRA